MAKSIAVLPKKRGRPATGKDPAIIFRAPPEMIERVDAWSARQKDTPSRSEAIRRLIEKALARAR